MPYYGPRVRPEPEIDRRTTGRIVKAFRELERQPMKQLKRATSYAKAIQAGIVPGDVERVNRPEAPNADRQRGSGGGPSGPSGPTGRESRASQPEHSTGDVRGAGPVPRRRYGRPAPGGGIFDGESSPATPGINPEATRRVVGRGPSESTRAGEGLAEALGQQVEGGTERGAMDGETPGLPPGDVRAPFGTPAGGGQPDQPGYDPRAASRGASRRGARSREVGAPRSVEYRLPEHAGGATVRRAAEPDLGAMLAGAFRETEQPGRYTAEAIEREPDLAGELLGRYGAEGGQPSTEVTPAMVRATPAPAEQKQAALEAIRQGDQEAAYNWYQKWGGRRPEGESSVPQRTEVRSVNRALRAMRSGEADSWAEAARIAGEATGYEPGIHDVADAAVDQLGPSEGVIRIYGSPDPGSTGQTYAAKLRARGFRPKQIISKMRQQGATEQELQDAKSYLTVDPAEMYTQSLLYRSLQGRGGGQ